MAFLETAAAVSSILGGLGGLFGKKKTADPRSNIHSAAKGAREAAEKYGFSPLTLLGLAGGGFGGTQAGGGAPPLASVELITGGLRDLSDVASGDADRRRQADQLKLDMARLEFEKLRSGVFAAAPSAAAGVGSGLPALGRHSNSIRGTNYGAGQSHFGMAPELAYNPQRTGLVVAGIPVEPSSAWSDAEEAEKRYGDFGASIYGLGVAASDFGRGAVRTLTQWADDLTPRDAEGKPLEFEHGFSKPKKKSKHPLGSLGF